MDRRWVLAAAVGLTSILAGAWWGRGVYSPAPAPESSPSLPAVSAPPVTILVHVAGRVARPGLVSVTAGSRVGDAVAAAGGVLPGAALEALNLAEEVHDGQQVVVPAAGEAPVPVGDQVRPGGGADGLVDINSADSPTLETLPGVGPVLAERIVSHREKAGPFETVEDLLDVPGIGEAKLASLRDHVSVR